MASAVKQVNPGADIIGTRHALNMNIVAAKSLADIVKTNLGPRGTMKMLVGGAGQIKVTKDGKVLLDEMQIQHPTAAIIARTATAQEDMTGDGTTSNVLFTGALLAESERYLAEGLHPRLLVEGMELAREHILKFLESYKQAVPAGPLDRDTLVQVARTALRTKLHEELADHLTEIVVDAVRTIEKANGVESTTLDLHMVEIMHMKHQSSLDTKFIDGLVLDHGARHPDMPKRCENVHILILNVSLEYEKSEVNAGFFYKSADERSRLVAAERKFTDDKVLKIIEFKNKVLPDPSKGTLMVINQKGIDPISLDMLQKAGIIGLRRAKKRNMERLSRACGGYAINAVDALEPDCLGFAKLAYEHSLGDDKYVIPPNTKDEIFTFIEGCQNPSSCTILVKGPNEHTIRQILDAVHDGLRAVKNVIEDRALVPGAGAFELAAHLELHKYKSQVQGRAKIGVAAFADALLTIPKVLASNSGLDAQTVLIDLLDEAANNNRVGLDIESGKPILPEKLGIWDNFRVKKQLLHLGSLIAIKLLLVDEIMRAGRKMGKA